MIEQADKPVPGDLLGAPSARFQARRDAIRVQAALALGSRKTAAPIAAKLPGWEVPQAQCALARFRATTGDPKSAIHLIDQAQTSAAREAAPGDALAAVGEQALGLGFWPQAAQSCAEASRRAPANYRALACLARADLELRRTPEALSAAEQALAINPTGVDATKIHAALSPAGAVAGP